MIDYSLHMTIQNDTYNIQNSSKPSALNQSPATRQAVLCVVSLTRVLGVMAFLLATLFVSKMCYGSEAIDMRVIAQIESSGNPLAYNYRSMAAGTFQVTPVCLKEWNNFYPKEKYSFKDLFKPNINWKIADWYMNNRIPKMLNYFHVEDSVNERLRAYNCGIKCSVDDRTPQETQRYIEKYHEKTRDN